MRMTIKKVKMQQFKGYTEKEVVLKENTSIFGANGAGKSTIFTAFTWLFFDRNSELDANPDIRPLNAVEALPRVDIWIDIDGQMVQLSKQQKRTVGKTDPKKVTITNQLFINEVPKTEKDFKADLAERGIDLSNMLALCHPDVFTNQKASDMRKVLFDMTSSLSDIELARCNGELKELTELLENYKVDEIVALQKASKKKADEQVESIPYQIIGLEKAKVELDADGEKARKEKLENRLAEINSALSSGTEVLEKFRQQKFELQFEYNNLLREANKGIIEERQKLQDEIDSVNREMSELRFKKETSAEKAKHYESEAKEYDLKRKQLGSEYESKKKETFDDGVYAFDDKQTVCKVCGQKLPAEQIADLEKTIAEKKEKASKEFEDRKKSSLDEILKEGFRLKACVEDRSKKATEFNTVAEDAGKKIALLAAKLNGLQSQLSMIPHEAETTTEMVELQKKDKWISEKISEIKNPDSGELLNEKQQIEDAIKMINKELSQYENNQNIDKQIEDLQEQQLRYEQSKADAEKVLYEIELLSRVKNEKLTSEINSHFDIVSFKLFDYQKNGGYKEVCEPMIDNKSFSAHSNGALKVLAKLDIIKGLQRYYNAYYPVFVDDFSVVTDNTEKLINMDCQLIKLIASKDVTELTVR